MSLWRKKKTRSVETKPDPARFSRALRRAAPSDVIFEADQEATRAACTDLNEAIRTITFIRTTLRSLGEVAASALATADLGAKALLAEQYEDARHKLTTLAETQNVSLLSPHGTEVVVPLPGNAQYVIHPARFDLESGPFHLPVPSSGFTEAAEITSVLEAIDRLIASLDTVTKTFEGDLRFVKKRLVA